MLKKIAFVFISSMGLFFYDFGQVVHKPVDILDIMNRSKVKYDVGVLTKDIPDKDYSGLLNEPYMYRLDSNDQTFVRKMVIAKEAKQEWNSAESAFRDDNYKEAQVHYKNVLDIQPDYYPAKMQIAKTFEKEEEFEKAEASYKQAMSKNYIDYLPHLLLAKVYLQDSKMEEAVDEITLASILNRNDTAILAAMRDIYQSAGLKFSYWVFTPQYELINEHNSNKVEVLSRKGWDGYAAVKAIWKFEPGYAVTQGEKPGRPSLLEEKECLINVMAYQDQHFDAELPKPFDMIKKAIDNKLLDGFIYYEILLPQNPSLAYQLPNNVIKVIKNYAVMAHGGEMPKKKK